jgi:hypothetical protein
MFTYDTNTFNDSLEVSLDGRPLGTLVKNYVGAYVSVDTGGTIQGIREEREDAACLLVGDPGTAKRQCERVAEAKQDNEDREWEQYCHDKSDPHDHAWGCDR